QLLDQLRQTAGGQLQFGGVMAVSVTQKRQLLAQFMQLVSCFFELAMIPYRFRQLHPLLLKTLQRSQSPEDIIEDSSIIANSSYDTHPKVQRKFGGPDPYGTVRFGYLGRLGS